MDIGSAGACQGFFGDQSLPAAVDHPEPQRRIADDDVVSHGQIRDQRQFLEDADDPSAIGRGRRGEGHLLAVEQHPAFVRGDDTRHDLDKGRFARTVLAENGVDGSRPNGNVGLFQRDDTAIALGYAFHPEKRFG